MDASARAAQALPHDPLWYKDAVIYQLHVKSFFDSNNDGIGDFPGLISKLDYIADLGVNAIWLLPFYPLAAARRRLRHQRLPRRASRLRHAGRRAALHRSGARPRHTRHHRARRSITPPTSIRGSSARAAPSRDSAWRNFYVWSDTDQQIRRHPHHLLRHRALELDLGPGRRRLLLASLLLPSAGPEFRQPARAQGVLRRHALLAGARRRRPAPRRRPLPGRARRHQQRKSARDPRDPQAHPRRARSSIYPDACCSRRPISGPRTSKDYFGDGDECHMAFHFPLMPRMYMAIGREDRFPITDIMRQTPDIPDNCQWAIFLRNHDELTLEMVTDSRARLPLGHLCRRPPRPAQSRHPPPPGAAARARPAPHRADERLLLSMPGTPVIYYGDEIGMGDNIHLGDRDGVRTPDAVVARPQRRLLARRSRRAWCCPPIMDPLYGYEAVNVEAQSRDPHSLLNWMRRMLAVRRQHARLWTRHAAVSLSQKPQSPRLSARNTKTTPFCASRTSRTARRRWSSTSRQFAGRVPVELNAGTLVSADRPADLSAHLAALWLLLVPAGKKAMRRLGIRRRRSPCPNTSRWCFAMALPVRLPAPPRADRARGTPCISRQAALVRRQGPAVESTASQRSGMFPAASARCCFARLKRRPIVTPRIGCCRYPSRGKTSPCLRCHPSSPWRECGGLGVWAF